MKSCYRMILLSALTICLSFDSVSAQCPDYYIFEDSKDDVNSSQAVDGAGDVNHDDTLDLILGGVYEPRTNGGQQTVRPQVLVLSGANGHTLTTYEISCGAYGYGGFGATVAGLGDLNGDGYPEVAFGVPGSDFGGDDRGRVLVFSSIDANDTIYDCLDDSGILSTEIRFCDLGQTKQAPR